VRATSAAFLAGTRADAFVTNGSIMEKYRKLIKRQQLEKSEESTDSRSRASSLAQNKQPIKSLEAIAPEQAIDEIVAVSSSPERWEPIEVYPSNSSTYSQWQQELREIEWEIENDIWESCPYD